MVLVPVGDEEDLAVGAEEVELDGEKREVGESVGAADRDDHGEVALPLAVGAARVVALEEARELRAPGGDDGQLVPRGDLL